MNNRASSLWLRGATPAQWRALVAATLGWTLDGMDVMLYAFALPGQQGTK